MKKPEAKTQMLIRKPSDEVFQAFISPEITSHFWFSKSSGKLEQGKKFTWTWDAYQLNIPLIVEELIPNKKIGIKWGEGEMASHVEWEFNAIGKDKTYVQITNSNFTGTEEEITHKVIDSVGGFTLVLAGAKAWLEHGIQLNLIGDKFPKELMQK